MSLDNNASLKDIMDTFEQINTKIIDRGGAQTITPGTSNKVLSKGNYKGDITVKGDNNLIASNILSGKSIFGVAGSVIAGKRWASGSATPSTATGNLKGSIAVTGLSFKPSIIIAYNGNFGCVYISAIGQYHNSFYAPNSGEGACLRYNVGTTTSSDFYVTSNAFRLKANPMTYQTSPDVTWYAFE